MGSIIQSPARKATSSAIGGAPPLDSDVQIDTGRLARVKQRERRKANLSKSVYLSIPWVEDGLLRRSSLDDAARFLCRASRCHPEGVALHAKLAVGHFTEWRCDMRALMSMAENT